MKKVINEFDQGPIQEGCTCRACTTYSKGYMRHLFKTNEILGAMLASEHNLTYLHTLMENIRTSIEADRFTEYKREYLSAYERK